MKTRNYKSGVKRIDSLNIPIDAKQMLKQELPFIFPKELVHKIGVSVPPNLSPRRVAELAGKQIIIAYISNRYKYVNLSVLQFI